MLLLALAAQAAEPFLGPLGWTVLGPFPGEIASARGTAVFDPATCAVEVAQVDLDGGPGFRDVRLARAYVGGRWEWLDDWRVADGVLSRPGRAPRPVAAFRGTLRTDAAGWVTHRSVDGVEVESCAATPRSSACVAARWRCRWTPGRAAPRTVERRGTAPRTIASSR